MEPLLNAIALASIAVIVLVLLSLRREHIRVEYSVSWLGAAVALLVLSRWRSLLERVGGWLGLKNEPASALVLLIILVLFVLSYRFSIVISRLKDANVALTQRIAMIEFRIRTLDEKQQADSSSQD
ncbi:MAG: DUF2304 domain-containing protein [Acidobacteriales bacterium]|nr:DUF2304 domain-containing protein [Terriglobales bacterium]